MTGHLKCTRAAGEVAAGTKRWICKLTLQGIVALDHNINGGPDRILHLPQRSSQMPARKIQLPSNRISRRDSAVEIPATIDSCGWRLRLTGEDQVKVQLLASPRTGASGRRVEDKDPSSYDL